MFGAAQAVALLALLVIAFLLWPRPAAPPAAKAEPFADAEVTRLVAAINGAGRP